MEEEMMIDLLSSNSKMLKMLKMLLTACKTTNYMEESLELNLLMATKKTEMTEEIGTEAEAEAEAEAEIETEIEEAQIRKKLTASSASRKDTGLLNVQMELNKISKRALALYVVVADIR